MRIPSASSIWFQTENIHGHLGVLIDFRRIVMNKNSLPQSFEFRI